MNSREVMMRTVEALSGGGIREPQRLLRDAEQIHDRIMNCPEDKPKRGRPSKAETGQAEAPE